MSRFACSSHAREPISKADTRYSDQCHWPIWNTIRGEERETVPSPLLYNLRVRIPTVRRASRSITRDTRSDYPSLFIQKPNRTLIETRSHFYLSYSTPKIFTRRTMEEPRCLSFCFEFRNLYLCSKFGSTER